jgi:hypothetical protein
LVYIRNDPAGINYYYLKCKAVAPRILGSGALAELCGKVKSKGISMDKSNQFYDKFKI